MYHILFRFVLQTRALLLSNPLSNIGTRVQVSGLKSRVFLKRLLETSETQLNWIKHLEVQLDLKFNIPNRITLSFNLFCCALCLTFSTIGALIVVDKHAYRKVPSSERGLRHLVGPCDGGHYCLPNNSQSLNHCLERLVG